MELKTDGTCHEYLLCQTTMNSIITWEDLPDVSIVKRYLKKHPFPKDSECSEENFLEHVEGDDQYIYLTVEKASTAEFIADLIYGLQYEFGED